MKGSLYFELKDEVATRELPPKGSCRDIITHSRNIWCHTQGMARPTKGWECRDKNFMLRQTRNCCQLANLKFSLILNDSILFQLGIKVATCEI